MIIVDALGLTRKILLHCKTNGKMITRNELTSLQTKNFGLLHNILTLQALQKRQRVATRMFSMKSFLYSFGKMLEIVENIQKHWSLNLVQWGGVFPLPNVLEISDLALSIIRSDPHINPT